MFLSKDIFSTVIENAPLVSIDLIVQNEQEQILLGQRLNRPAQNYWFVPGGRVLKDESLELAFKRLTKDELGQEFTIEEAHLLGAFNHFYTDNVFNDDFSTHYIALAHTVKIEGDLEELPMDVQHEKYQWFSIDELMGRDDVHKYTKLYFENRRN